MTITKKIVGIGLVAAVFLTAGCSTHPSNGEVLEDRVGAQKILSEHYLKRLKLHPSRDIFPADIFFYGDEVKLTAPAPAILDEYARLSKTRLPSSRLVVAVYAKANSKESTFAKHLTEKRALAITDQLVRSGIEPRRLVSRAIVTKGPIVLDPDDDPRRYDQAVEFIMLDR